MRSGTKIATAIVCEPRRNASKCVENGRQPHFVRDSSIAHTLLPWRTHSKRAPHQFHLVTRTIQSKVRASRPPIRLHIIIRLESQAIRFPCIGCARSGMLSGTERIGSAFRVAGECENHTAHTAQRIDRRVRHRLVKYWMCSRVSWRVIVRNSTRELRACLWVIS